MRQGAALVLLLVATAIGLAASGSPSSSSRPTEAAKVLRVAEAGRAAVLANRPRDLCRLLTKQAQRNSRRSVGYAPYARRRKLPRTCASGAGYEIRLHRSYPDFKRARRDPSLASFRVVRIKGNRARVHLAVPTPDGYSNDADIIFLRTGRGWRADSANFSPWDGSSGE